MRNKTVPIRLILLIVLWTFLFPPIDAEAGRGWHSFSNHGYISTQIDGSTEFFTKSQFRIGLGSQNYSGEKDVFFQPGLHEVYFLKQSDIRNDVDFNSIHNYDYFMENYFDKVVNQETVIDITKVEDGYESPIMCNRAEDELAIRYCGETVGYWNQPLDDCELLDVFIFRKDETHYNFGSSIRQYDYRKPLIIGPCDEVIHVDKSATDGGNTGVDWANAYTSLQTALANANPGDTIWVAKGVYTPGTDRDDTFQLREGVAIHGGFEPLLDRPADPVYRYRGDAVTVLSGDIDGDDTADDDGVVLTAAGQVGENSYHVVTSDGVSANTVLDGFTITAGQANGTDDDTYGGGMHNNSNLTLSNITFSGNSSSYYGGGLYNQSSNPKLTNVTFNGNTSVYGGGMSNYYSNPTLSNITFTNNNSRFGGGLYNQGSSPTLTSVTFINNSASSYGGGMHNNGGSPILTSVTFSNNSASSYGGGMHNNDGSPILTNVTFSNNSASSYGGGMHNNGGSPTLNSVIFTHNSSNDGGGMYNNDSTPMLINVTFAGNSSTYGGGISNEYSAPVLTNVTFSGNNSTYGGGMSNYFNSGPMLTNVTFSGNNSTYGGAMRNSDSSPTIRNSIFWNNQANGLVGVAVSNMSNVNGSNPTISYSLAQGSGGSGAWNSDYGVNGGNNIDSNPLFMTPVDPATAPTLILGDLQLKTGSPAIDTGNTSSYTNPITIDLAGNYRVQNSTIDMGAYESPYICSPTGLVYVNQAVSGGLNDGSSWANATTSLQNALTVRHACLVEVTEIWVATGVYTPGISQSDTFKLLDRVSIYGGFDATEAIRSERDWATNITVLSGDIHGDDDAYASGVVRSIYSQAGDNSYHVVTSHGVTANTVLDGFTITAGQANGTGYDGSGGGVSSDNSSLILNNVSFRGNLADGYGGGMYNLNGNPTLNNVTFSRNDSNDGGGMYNLNSNSTLNNVTFSYNGADDGYGGGMYNDNSSPALNNITFTDNSSNDGGGMYNRNSNPTLGNVTFTGNRSTYGGGMSNDYSAPILTNVTFSGNRSTYGGGMSNYFNSGPMLTNVTFSGNKGTYGGGMYNNNSNPTSRNSIFWDNQTDGLVDTVIATMSNVNGSNPIISHSLVQASGGSGAWNSDYGVDGGNNIDNDPRFRAPVAPLDAYTLFFGDLQLQMGSPAIDAGSNASYTSPATTDVAGNKRIQNNIIDMGAYESAAYLLTAMKSGSGSGSLLSNPATIDCGPTCTASFPSGTMVTLTAIPDAGSTFTGWSGAGCSGTASCVVTIDAAKSVTATFELPKYVLATAMAGTGSGTVSKSPDSASYTQGTTVTLTATPAAGSTFTGWSGAGCSGTAKCVVTIDAAKSVTAKFDLKGHKVYLPLVIR